MLAIVNCHTLSVTQLRDALLSLESHSSDSGDESVILAFLLGPGSAWTNEATMDLEDGKGEIDTEEAVNAAAADARAVVERCVAMCQTMHTEGYGLGPQHEHGIGPDQLEDMTQRAND